jgi:hypothetical protein
MISTLLNIPPNCHPPRHGEKANWRIGELRRIGEKARGTFANGEKPSIYAIFFTVCVFVLFIFEWQWQQMSVMVSIL